MRATASTYDRSVLPSGAGGVGTAMKTTSESCTARSASVVNESRPDCVLRRTISSRPGSKIGISPASSRSILPASLSTQVTRIPNSAKHAPVTRPT